MGNICEKWATPMCSWMLGTEVGLDSSLGKFPGLVPALVGCSGALSSFRALPELFTWVERKILGERKGLYVSSSPPPGRIKAMKKVPELPVVLNLWWVVIIQPIFHSLKTPVWSQKRFFKR